jgi:hypothetical protein
MILNLQQLVSVQDHCSFPLAHFYYGRCKDATRSKRTAASRHCPPAPCMGHDQPIDRPAGRPACLVYRAARPRPRPVSSSIGPWPCRGRWTQAPAPSLYYYRAGDRCRHCMPGRGHRSIHGWWRQGIVKHQTLVLARPAEISRHELASTAADDDRYESERHYCQALVGGWHATFAYLVLVRVVSVERNVQYARNDGARIASTHMPLACGHFNLRYSICMPTPVAS